jgi:chromosome segregation ATPase
LNRRVQSLEGDLETCEDKLLLATQKLDKAATAAGDSARMRKVLESRALQDEERMGKLEEELNGARNQAEDADKKYDEIAKRLQQVEGELERAEERAEVGEIKIVKLEEELRVVANQREVSYKEQIKTLSASRSKSRVL